MTFKYRLKKEDLIDNVSIEVDIDIDYTIVSGAVHVYQYHIFASLPFFVRNWVKLEDNIKEAAILHYKNNAS